MVAEQSPDPRVLEALAERAAAGDRAALSQWVEQLWPFLVTLARSNSSMRPLAATDDHVHNVVQRVVEKISLRVGSYVRWKGAHPEKDVLDWIRIVTKNAIRDYVRAQLGPRQASDQPSVKRLLNEFSSSEHLEERGQRPAFTAAETARELYEFAQRHLTPAQLGVLSRWLEGQSFEEIAEELGVQSSAAAPLLHAGIAVLRRHFREDSPLHRR